MAFLDDDDLDQSQTDQSKDTSQNSGGPILTAGGNGVMSSGSMTNPNQSGSSGLWTNLNSYLDANKDQSDQMGNQLVGNLNTEGQTAQSGIDKTSQDFQNDLNSSGTSLTTEQPWLDSTLAAPVQNNTSDDDSRFQNDLSGQYAGPNNLSDESSYGDTDTDVNKATTDLGLSGSEAGRMTLLQDQYGANGQQYNQGEQSLDQLLLEGNPNTQAGLQSSQDQYANLGSNWATAATTANQNSQQRIADTNAVNQYAQTGLGNDYTTEGTNLDNTVASDTAARDAAYQSMLADASKPSSLTQADAEALGLSPGQTLYNTTLPSYITEGTGQIDRSNVATADDYAKMAALAGLSGQAQTVLPGTAPSGTVGPYVNVNQSQLQSDLAQQAQSYQNALKGPNAQIAADQSGMSIAYQKSLNGIEDPDSMENAIQQYKFDIAAQQAKLTALGQQYGANNTLPSYAQWAGIGAALNKDPKKTVGMQTRS